MTASTIAAQVHKLIEPKLAQLEQNITQAEKEAERVLAALTDLRSEQEVALRVLQTIPMNGNGHTNGGTTEKTVRVGGKPGAWLEKVSVGRRFTYKTLLALEVCGTPQSAQQTITVMKQAGRIELVKRQPGRHGVGVYRKVK